MGKSRRNPVQLVKQALKSLESYQQAKTKDGIPSPKQPRQERWQRPPLVTLKVNTDATMFEDEDMISLGVIINDAVLAARTEKRRGGNDVVKAEYHV